MGSKICSCFELKRGVDFSPFFKKLMGSRAQFSKIDGFSGTHGTHINRATDNVHVNWKHTVPCILLVNLIFSTLQIILSL